MKSETVYIITNTSEMMEIKDAYSLFDTKSVVKFMLEEQHPGKEILMDKGFTIDPHHLDNESVKVSAQARVKC